MARLVVDQIYQELITSDNLSVKHLKLFIDQNGYIKLSNLIVFLDRYKIDLNDEETDIIMSENGTFGPTGDRLVWFSKLLEDCICKFLEILMNIL